MGIIVTRSYVVADWRKTRCPVDCDEAVQYGPACPHQRWFPIHSLVQTRHDEEGVLLSAHCRPKRTAKADEPARPRMKAAPGVWRHAVKKEWGTAVVAEEAHDRRVFRFETGTLRTFRPSHYHLMERIQGAEAPAEEQAPAPGRSAVPCCPDDDPDNRCRHIKLALKAVDGTLGVPGPDDTDDKVRRRIEREKELVDLSSISRMNTDDRMPKCPNCRETWSVSRISDEFSCRSPVCQRADRRGRMRPWRFTLGTDNTPPKAGRHEWTFDYLDGKRLR